MIKFWRFKKNNIFKFILPNLKYLLSKRVTFSSIPFCEQTLIISGQGKVVIGNKCVFGTKLGGFYRRGYVELQARKSVARIVLGNNIACNNNLFICSENYIEIGDDCLIGQYVNIFDSEAHGIHPDKRRGGYGEIGSVKISNNVWIGNNVTILKNTNIGENTIVAAGAVVAGNFPSNVIIGGVPAKIIKSIT
jgi:acetyltransferase-like isoleucine patch superfamily enzyme